MTDILGDMATSGANTAFNCGCGKFSSTLNGDQDREAAIMHLYACPNFADKTAARKMLREYIRAKRSV